MDAYLSTEGGTWIGWPGITTPTQSGWRKSLNEYASRKNYGLEPVAISESDFDDYYRGAANSMLWPLFHGFVERCEFDHSWWQTYREINQTFAKKISGAATAGDVIWVHDYHLMLTGRQLDRQTSDFRTGFFSHIPFPPPEEFFTLPWHDDILDGLTSFDVIGFQTRQCVNNFERCLASTDDSTETLPKEAQTTEETQRCDVQHFPIGADTETFTALAEQVSDDQVDELKKDIDANQLLLGVERLDYSKGLPQRLRAFDRFLEKHPHMHGRVKLFQLVVPSRTGIEEYQRLKKEVDELVGRIQGRFSTTNWNPIRFVFGTVSQRVLTALYRAASVAVVTPLRDGMNLVAKEFCAARTDDAGALVLSKFAGAAEQLGDGAIVINPYDTEETADALYRGVTLSRDEKRERMTQMRDTVLTHNVQDWAERYLSKLRGDRRKERNDLSIGRSVKARI
jgi:trehalose 6-phosphate synthase